MARGKIRAIERRNRQPDPYLDLLFAVFRQAFADARATRWHHYAPALSWLKSSEIRQLALVLDIHLPDPAAIAAVADRKRKCATKKAVATCATN